MGLKILHMAESGGGKTCALKSLLDAGYNVRVADLDNNITGLLNIIGNSPARARLAYVTITEHMRLSQGRIFPAKAVMWPELMRLLDGWKNDDPMRGDVCDLGPVSKWTEQDVLVIDTLSALGQGALHFGLQMNGALGAVRSSNESRRDIGAAQQHLRNFMMYLSDSSLRCHIIVNTHITYVRADGSGVLVLGDSENVPTKGYPSAIGRATSPEIPRYFSTILLSESVGSGAATRRKTYTVTRGNINLKNAAPLNVAPEYDQTSALADYFKAVLEATAKKPTP